MVNDPDSATMADALASIGIPVVCDKHAPGRDRCKGSGYVCSAHPHTPPSPLVPGGCACGATVVTCYHARTAPILVRIPVGRTVHEVWCHHAPR